MRVCSLSFSARLVNGTPSFGCEGSPAGSSLPLLLETTILFSRKRRKNVPCSLRTHFQPCSEKICCFACVSEGLFHQLCCSFFYIRRSCAWHETNFDDARPFSSAFIAPQSVVPQMFIVSEWKRINRKPNEHFAEL